MKHYILYALVLSCWFSYPKTFVNLTDNPNFIQNTIDRRLSEEEVLKRGLGLLATEVIEKIDEIDLRKMARSSIFETSYGFRWKMINVKTGKIIIVKVNKNFELISVRNSKRRKAI